MTTAETLREHIVAERRQRGAYAQAAASSSELHLLEQVKSGAGQRVMEDLFFFTPPRDFVACLERLYQEIRGSFNAADECLQVDYLRFLADVTLSLRSFLPRWNLQNADRSGETALTHDLIQAQADTTCGLAAELAAQARAAKAELLAEWRAENAARLRAEQAAHPETEAEILVGNSVGEYLAHLSVQIAGSHLRRIAEMRLAGETLTEVSNDYAAFLQYAMYLGASFATINPPLVHAAWVADPQRWDPVVDRIIAENPEADEDGLARLVTMEVVLANMRLLRPVFLLSEGRMGCVCLQVNPKQHGNAAVMTSDALFMYEALRAKLEGGVPNVVFKLPGTRAGLETCRALTQRGIGVTITVDFGMFQHLPFAQAIRDGQSIFSCLVEMSGRLAYPVRDELLARLDELAAYGIGEAQAREAAAWSGIVVLKRLYRLLSARGYDLARVKPLVASLRIYAGQDYATLPNAFPDITEVLGASIISVFPNIRRPFDALPELELAPRRIETPVPDDILERLSHSQIFRQAYYVADRDWMPEGDDRFRPDHELTLEDEAATAAWAPVRNTLAEFCDSYGAFVGRIMERKGMLDTQQEPRVSGAAIRP